MNVALWISTIALALPVAYSLRFTGATLSLGKALGETTSGTGYQAAISPPWEVAFGLVVYGLTLAMLAFSWYAFGVGRAIVSLVGVSSPPCYSDSSCLAKTAFTTNNSLFSQWSVVTLILFATAIPSVQPR